MKHLMLALVFVMAAAASVLTVTIGCAPASRAAAVRYQCPMHPEIIADKPAECPICGMDLVPMKPDEPKGTNEPAGASAVPGRVSVSLAPDARERIGLTWGVVEQRPLTREIRTSARIVPDETRLHHVVVKIDGYVEKLFAATTGESVRQGEPLLTVYSPALVSAQEEYLNAVKANPALAGAARRRLQLWDIPDDQIDRLATSGVPERAVTLIAPANGTIIERNIAAGHRVMAGEQLMVLGDLSQVWADADVYQSDLPSVSLGMPVELTVSAVPGVTYTGKVSFISPVLDAGTRTVKVRMDVPNAGMRLKPEMYGVARLAFDLGEKTAVPEAAVLRTGDKAYAFREGEGNRIVPVPVALGARGDGWYEVRDGLKPGDRVVTSANFLVDSESAMKAAIESVSGE